MSHPPPNSKLVGAPYALPGLKAGERVLCELRGQVTIGGLVETPIGPWPRVRARGPHQLILCGDLIRAVKTEANVAVSYWWSASESTVTRWRQCLGIGPYDPPGTKRLQAVNVTNIGEDGQQKSVEAQRRPEVREKHRKLAIGNSSGKPKWTKTHDEAARYLPSADAATAVARSRVAVISRRQRRGFKNYRLRITANLRALRTSAGKSQREIAHECGVSPQVWQRLERGRRTRVIVTSLLKIAKALGVAATHLLTTTPGAEWEVKSGYAPACSNCQGPLESRRSIIQCQICGLSWMAVQVPNAHLVPRQCSTSTNWDTIGAIQKGRKRQRGGRHSGRPGSGPRILP